MANDALKALANTLKADIAKTTSDFAGVLKLGNNRRTDAALKPVTDDLKKETTDVAAVISGINALDGTVTKQVTTTTLTSSPNPSTSGQEVTLTATVKAASGTPGGSIQFWRGSVVVGAVAVANGVAVLKTTTLPVGDSALAASYGGDAGFAASTTTAALTQKVNPVVQTGTPSMTVAPTWDLGSVGTKGGPFTPNSIGYDVKNPGTGVLHWSATPDQSWATCTPAAGTLAAGETVEVIVSVNAGANALDVGWPEAIVTFNNSDNGTGNTTRSVKLTVQTGATTTDLTLGPSSLSGGTVGTAYNETVGASGGTTPYVYSVITGALPAGLALNASSGAITGTPTTKAIYSFAIQAKDATGKTATRDYTVVVSNTIVTTGPRTFALSSFWYSELPANVTLHPDSAKYAAEFVGQVEAYYKHVSINTDAFCSPVFIAPAGTPTVKVNSIRDIPALQAQWLAVPIPSFAKPSAGTDGEMCIHQPSSDTMWEFWQAEKRSDGWWANWGGRMDNVSKDNGIWDDITGRWGTTATGLPFLGGQITAEELKAGEIKHVIGIAMVNTLGWATFSWPANRSDGWSSNENPGLFAEGLRLRLDPSINIDAINILPAAKVICKALQKYGAVVWDRSGSVGMRCQNSMSYTALGQPDPYWDAGGLFVGASNQWNLFEGVPWDRMQFMPMDYGMP